MNDGNEVWIDEFSHHTHHRSWLVEKNITFLPQYFDDDIRICIKLFDDRDQLIRNQSFDAF